MSFKKNILSLSIFVNTIFITFLIVKLFNYFSGDNLENNIKGSYWQDKVSQYEVLNSIGGEKIFFVGDSMVDRYNVEEFFPRKNIFNRGNAWDDTYTLLSRIDNTVLNGNPKKIILFIGGNDILYGVDKSISLNNLKELCERIISKKVELIVISILPVWKENKRSNKDIVNFNALLRELCKKNKIEFLDIFSKFLSSDNELRRELSSDGVHLNGKGYELFTKEIAEFL